MRPRAMLVVAAVVVLVHASSGLAGGLVGGFPDPEDGAIVERTFQSPYFGFEYPLQPGWTAGLEGPPPSRSGYYVLTMLVPTDAASATLLVTAQDRFFAAKPQGDAAASVAELAETVSRTEGMRIDQPPVAVAISGRAFTRLDFSGAGLHRVMLATEQRCHIVSFLITARDAALAAELALSLDRLAFDQGPDAGAAGLSGLPCIGGYAVAENLVRRTDPRPAPGAARSIAVRLIIGADGKVAHVHPIGVPSEQRRRIEDALARWEFRPYQVDGHALTIETGAVLDLMP